MLRSRCFQVTIVVCAFAGALAGRSAHAQPQAGLESQMRAQAEASAALLEPDALRVVVCGSASPMGADPNRAQACIAVIAGKRIFVVDVGAGSAKNLTRAGVPAASIEAVLLTHFHSDHIADLGGVNMSSWVGGRKQQLTVMGPEGVERVVKGFNEAYALDRSYRTAHHGDDLVPAALGEMKPETVTEGVIYDQEDVKVTAFPVDHAPIEPAFGYRIDYGGRSVVVSGDTVKSPDLIAVAKGADLLFHDTLLTNVVELIAAARKGAGDERTGKIIGDVLDYHASREGVFSSGAEAGVKRIVLYHLVPVPMNPMIASQFLASAPDNVSMADDGMLFTLPTESAAIEVTQLFGGQ